MVFFNFARDNCFGVASSVSATGELPAHQGGKSSLAGEQKAYPGQNSAHSFGELPADPKEYKCAFCLKNAQELRKQGEKIQKLELKILAQQDLLRKVLQQISVEKGLKSSSVEVNFPLEKSSGSEGTFEISSESSEQASAQEEFGRKSSTGKKVPVKNEVLHTGNARKKPEKPSSHAKKGEKKFDKALLHLLCSLDGSLA